jgi:hypothetical protein
MHAVLLFMSMKREDVVLTDDQHTELYASTKESRAAFLARLLTAFREKDPEIEKEARELEQFYLREFNAKLDEILNRPPVVVEEKKPEPTGFARHA